MPQKPAAQPTLALRVANFVKKFPNVGTNSHARRTQGNRVLVGNVDVIMIIIFDANFALNKVTVMFNMTVILLKVSAPLQSEHSVRSVRVWFDTQSVTSGSHVYDTTSPYKYSNYSSNISLPNKYSTVRLFVWALILSSRTLGTPAFEYSSDYTLSSCSYL